jgi:hypothetical protein
MAARESCLRVLSVCLNISTCVCVSHRLHVCNGFHNICLSLGLHEQLSNVVMLSM